MKLTRLGITLSSLLLALTLSSCDLEPLPLGYVSIYLENYVENESIGNETQPCAGGLNAQLIEGQKTVYESVNVLPGRASSEHRYSEFNNGFGVEKLLLTVRTFCYGPQGQELGYAEATHTFGNGGGGLAAVTLRDSTDECSESVSRGEAPCININLHR